MTGYQKEITRIRDKIYSKDYLCSQVIQSKFFIDKNFAGNINLKDISGKVFDDTCGNKIQLVQV